MNFDNKLTIEIDLKILLNISVSNPYPTLLLIVINLRLIQFISIHNTLWDHSHPAPTPQDNFQVTRAYSSTYFLYLQFKHNFITSNIAREQSKSRFYTVVITVTLFDGFFVLILSFMYFFMPYKRNLRILRIIWSTMLDRFEPQGWKLWKKNLNYV